MNAPRFPVPEWCRVVVCLSAASAVVALAVSPLLGIPVDAEVCQAVCVCAAEVTRSVLATRK